MSQFSLLRKRRFSPFFITQFLGAFNDNLMKNILVVVITFGVSTRSSLSTSTLVNLAAGLFILPFFLFSAIAGQIADKFEKSKLIRRIKVAEIVVMLIAAIGFFANSPEFLLAILFLMGTQSAFFGPVKYSILPQHLRENELVGGNALVETGTFLAILLGTLLGPMIYQLGNITITIVLVGIAFLGWLSSLAIPKAPSVSQNLTISRNFLAQTWRIVESSRENHTVFLSMIGISWFWFYGATFVSQMPAYVRDTLGGDASVFALLVATFSAGIGIGSLLCERLSGKLIEIGLVPFGACGMTIFAIDLSLLSIEPPSGTLTGVDIFLRESTNLRVISNLLLIAVFGGFFIVPLYALVQSRSNPEKRSQTIAANNILNAAFMVLAAIMAITLLSTGLSISQLFLIIACMNAAIALVIFKLEPEFILRFILWILIRTAYRLKKQSLENIPTKGAAILACNHLSYINALIIMAASPRPVRFLINQEFSKTPILNFIFRTSCSIPLDLRKNHENSIKAVLAEITSSIEKGDLIGFFQEEIISKNLKINTFNSVIENIIQRNAVSTIPLSLQGTCDSFFSKKQKLRIKNPIDLLPRVFRKVTLIAGNPIPPAEISLDHLEKVILALQEPNQ